VLRLMELLFRWMLLGVGFNGVAVSLDENKSDIYIYMYIYIPHVYVTLSC